MYVYYTKARDKFDIIVEKVIGAKTMAKAIELLCEYCHETFNNDSWRVVEVKEIKDMTYNGIFEQIIY